MNAGNQAALSLTRSVLIAFGAFIVANGWATAEMVNQGIGAAMIVLPAIWGMVQKAQAEKSAKARETSAVQAGITAVKVGAAPVTVGPIGPLHAAVIIREFAPNKP